MMGIVHFCSLEGGNAKYILLTWKLKSILKNTDGQDSNMSNGHLVKDQVFTRYNVKST